MIKPEKNLLGFLFCFSWIVKLLNVKLLLVYFWEVILTRSKMKLCYQLITQKLFIRLPNRVKTLWHRHRSFHSWHRSQLSLIRVLLWKRHSFLIDYESFREILVVKVNFLNDLFLPLIRSKLLHPLGDSITWHLICPEFITFLGRFIWWLQKVSCRHRTSKWFSCCFI